MTDYVVGCIFLHNIPIPSILGVSSHPWATFLFATFLFSSTFVDIRDFLGEAGPPSPHQHSLTHPSSWFLELAEGHRWKLKAAMLRPSVTLSVIQPHSFLLLISAKQNPKHSLSS